MFLLQIKKQHRGRLAKNQETVEKEEEESSTVFTDKDFDTFDEQYQVERDFWKN